MEVYFGLLFFVSIISLIFQEFRFVGIRSRKQLKIRNKNTDYVNSKNSILAFILPFLILATFSAIRDGIGSDYYAYWRHILIIQSGKSNYMEPGFQFLVRLLQHVDPNPRFVIIVMGIMTCLFYMKAIWDQSENISISLFIFLSWGYYFFTLTTIRNYFALSIVIFSIKYLNKKKYIAFFGLVILAALFHKSALICIPLYLLATRKFNKKHYIIMAMVTFILLLLKNYLRILVFYIYPEYENGAYDDGSISYLNIIKAVVVIILGVYYLKRNNDDEFGRLYFNLNVFSLIFYVGMYWTPEASRIGFYMNATSIVFLPRIIRKMPKKNKVVFTLALIGGSLILFYLLCRGFQGPTIRLLPYKTWLFDGSY